MISTNSGAISWLRPVAFVLAVLGSAACTDVDEVTAPTVQPVMSAQSANNANFDTRFTLVDGAKTAVMNVEGTYRESDPITGDRVHYDAYGQFKITLSAVPTNDTRTRVSGNRTYVDAQWERWSPTVTGTVVVVFPDGERSFSYNHQGLASYRSTRSDTYNSTAFEVDSYMGGSSGSGFNWVNARLWSNEASTDGDFPLEGDASLRAWATNALDSDLYLRGTYSLADSPGGNGGQDTSPATDIITRRGKLPKYRVVTKGMHLVMDLDGTLQVQNEDGSSVTHPADATLTTNMTPNWSTGGTYRYYENPYGSYWYERTNVWFTTPQQFQGSVTVHYPDGDVTFHVNFDNNISSGADIYRNSYDPDHWRVTSYYDWGFGVAESGPSPIDFVENYGSLKGYNTDPELPPTGDADFTLSGYDGRLRLRGTYQASGVR